MEIDDCELIERILGGDIESFRVIVNRHQAAVFRFAFGLVGNRDEAQDITQEVFLAAYTSLSKYDSSRATLPTWLFTMSRNRCINWLKRNRPTSLEAPDAIPGVDFTNPVVRTELSQQLDKALAALPVEQRSAFVLAEVEELPYAEIARIEQTTLGTVKSRIHRARQRLQSLLQPVVGERE